MATVHELKIRNGYFDAVESGAKPFEVRDGRNHHYSVGDVLELSEIVDAGEDGMRAHPTGRVTRKRITYILALDEFFELVQLWKYGSAGGCETDVHGWLVLGLEAYDG